MDNSALLAWLAMATLLIVLGLGVFQFFRVRNSQAKRGERPGGIAGPSED